MIVDFTRPILSMPDGSYVVTTKDPVYPYNVLPDDPLFLSIITWLNGQGNFATPYVPPQPVDVDPEMQLNAEIMMDYIDTQKATKKWQDRLAELKKP